MSKRTKPLKPSALAVLATLRKGPRTGVEILGALEEAGTSILGPGTLYRVLTELRASGWVERVQGVAETDERHVYHGLTEPGLQVLEAEAGRLRRTLDVAGLLDSP